MSSLSELLPYVKLKSQGEEKAVARHRTHGLNRCVIAGGGGGGVPMQRSLTKEETERCL